MKDQQQASGIKASSIVQNCRYHVPGRNGLENGVMGFLEKVGNYAELRCKHEDRGLKTRKQTSKWQHVCTWKSEEY